MGGVLPSEWQDNGSLNITELMDRIIWIDLFESFLIGEERTDLDGNSIRLGKVCCLSWLEID